MRPIQFTSTTYPAADDDSIALSQTPGAAGNLTLAGALVSGGVATISPPAFITFTSLANLSARSFTITGKSPEGRAQSLAVTGPNANTVTSTLAWSEASVIAVDAATGAALSAGTAQGGYGSWIPLDIMVPNQATTISSDITGTINYTWQFTNDDVFGQPPSFTVTPSLIKAWDHPTAGMVAATTDQYSSVTTLMRAVRFVVNSGSGTARNVIAQQSTQ